MVHTENAAINYSAIREDENVYDTLNKMLQLAKQKNQSVISILGGIALEVTPSMDIKEVHSAWQQAFQEKKSIYQQRRLENDKEDEAVKKEPFDIRDHALYLKEIYDFYTVRTFSSSVPEFMAYWGKLMQLRTKEQPLTQELALQTMEKASRKTGVSPTKCIQELMTVVWYNGKDLAKVLGQDVDYCDVFRAVKSDEAITFYGNYQVSNQRRRNRNPEELITQAGCALAIVLKTKKRVENFYKILTGKKDLLPGAVIQIQPPVSVLPLPSDSDWAADPNAWKKHLKKVCDAAEEQLDRTSAQKGFSAKRSSRSGL